MYCLLPWFTHMIHKVVVQLYCQISWKCHCQKGKWICEMTDELIEKMSHVREVWFKIRCSIKIALWNLCALCQWSACPAVNVSLSSSPHTDFGCIAILFFWLSFHPLSLLSISSLWTVYFSLSVSSYSHLQLHRDLPQLCVMLNKASCVIWCCLFRGNTYLYLMAGMIARLSCPIALKVARSSVRRWTSTGKWQAKEKMMDQRWEETEKNSQSDNERKERGCNTFMWSRQNLSHSTLKQTVGARKAPSLSGL